MEIILSARHFDVSDELKEYVGDKVGRLGEEYSKLTTARVVLSLERNWQVAEAHVNGKHLDLEAKASTNDMYASVDEMFDKLEKQLRRHLERLQEHRDITTISEVILPVDAGAFDEDAADEEMEEELQVE